MDLEKTETRNGCAGKASNNVTYRPTGTCMFPSRSGLEYFYHILTSLRKEWPVPGGIARPLYLSAI
jgi:hypothetical protein